MFLVLMLVMSWGAFVSYVAYKCSFSSIDTFLISMSGTMAIFVMFKDLL